MGHLQGTNVPPKMPIKNLMAYSEYTPLAVPARPEGTAPMRRRAAMTFLGPKRSTIGPTTRRTIKVAQRATMFELPNLYVRLARGTRNIGLSTYQLVQL